VLEGKGKRWGERYVYGTGTGLIKGKKNRKIEVKGGTPKRKKRASQKVKR